MGARSNHFRRACYRSSKSRISRLVQPEIQHSHSSAPPPCLQQRPLDRDERWWCNPTRGTASSSSHHCVWCNARSPALPAWYIHQACTIHMHHAFCNDHVLARESCRLQCCTLLSGHRHVCHTVLLLEQQSCNCKAQADRTKPTLSFVRVGFASPGCADPERTVFGANAFVRDSKGVALWSSAEANAPAVLPAKGTFLQCVGCCTDAQPGLTHSPFGTCFKDEPLAIALLVQPIERGSHAMFGAETVRRARYDPPTHEAHLLFLLKYANAVVNIARHAHFPGIVNCKNSAAYGFFFHSTSTRSPFEYYKPIDTKSLMHILLDLGRFQEVSHKNSNFEKMNRIGGGRFVRMGSRWASSAGGGSATDAASTAATAAAAAAVTSTSSYTISTPGSANGIQMGARVGGSQTRARGRVGWGAVQDQLEGRRVPARRNASGIGQPLMSSCSSVQHNGGGGRRNFTG